MKRLILSLALAALACGAFAQEFNRMPYSYKWLGDKEVAFTYNGMYTDDTCFKLVMPKGTKVTGVKAPEKFSDFPLAAAGRRREPHVFAGFHDAGFHARQ